MAGTMKQHCGDGRTNLIPLSAATREPTSVGAGDTAEVDPSGSCGRDGGAASSPGVYESLSYSARRRCVEPPGDATTPATRSRRISKVLADLKAGKK